MSQDSDDLKHFLSNLIGEVVAKSNDGSSCNKPLYDKAESVRPASITGYVFVTYNGVEYGPANVTWGPLDFDKKKSTVLIQDNDGKWIKLWFFDRDLNP